MSMGELTSKVCAHRSVDRNGRIICKKIVEGDNEVSPNTCRDCPAKEIGCSKLRFSLRKFSPSNGTVKLVRPSRSLIPRGVPGSRLINPLPSRAFRWWLTKDLVLIFKPWRISSKVGGYPVLLICREMNLCISL